jgi:hydrophobic/amphiphilic exporter-1 (mainly G- bacteria), HAE1 family
MNFSEIFIRKPIATSLLMLAIALFGVLAYRALPVSDLPNVDSPTLSVSASLPGAAPETMANSVATPLERQFTSIAGLDSMISTNSLGGTSITLQFDLNRDIDGASVDVETAIAECMPLLPPGMPSPPSFRKSNPGDFPILFLAVTSPTLPLYKLDEYAETTIAQRISMVSGVAQVNVWGSAKYAVRVQVDPDKLAAKQIGINEIDQALQNWNVNVPTGTLYGPFTAYNVQASGQLMNAGAFRPTVVAWRKGTPVRLEQVANVIDSLEDDKNLSLLYMDHKPGVRAISLMVMKQPGANTIETTDEIKRLMPFFQAQLPESVHLILRSDRSKTIREAFRDIQFTMIATLGLVIMVIFLFLRNASATMIPAMALPFSIVGTFAVMYLMNYSLDQLSLMALILSVGFVVDDAIVMLENIVRHMERGEGPMESAFRGSREIGFTIVSMTISLAAVFIPVLFMAGLLGRLFREFAVTICVAILISGLVSITLTPMLCSRFLRHSTNPGRFSRIMERPFDAMLHGYDRSLGWVLHHRPVMLGVFFAVLVATGYLYVKVPKGFIPETDADQMYVNSEAEQGTSFYKMAEYQKTVAEILRKDPTVLSFQFSVGSSNWGSSGSNQSRLMAQLVPRRERKESVFQIVERLRPQFSRFTGIKVMLMIPPAIRVGGRGSRTAYDFTLQGPDTTDLFRQAQKLERLVARLPEVQDVNSDLQIKMPRVNLEVDRDKAAALQLNEMQIQRALYDAYGPQWASTIYAPTNQFKVLLEVLPKYQTHADYLSRLYFKSTDDHLIPLEAVVKTRTDASPQTVNHSGQLPSVTISFNTRSGVALGDAVDAIQQVAEANLPATITTGFQGTAKVFQDSLKNLTLLLIIAIGVVYIVLGVLYESYIHPLTILSGLPSAGFGALLTLVLFKVDLSIYAFVGLMMLVGIVKKNAIMQIDFALEAERREFKTPAEAIYEGCLIRFRPIMMTTMAAMLGAVPIALGWGSGGEARRPLGLSVAGGLLFSQMITLYLTPVVYTYNAAIVEKWRKWKTSDQLAPATNPLADS